jgi:hypothetical protein
VRSIPNEVREALQTIVTHLAFVASDNHEIALARKAVIKWFNLTDYFEEDAEQ